MDIRDVRNLAANETLSCDVCVVGSGPAGLTLAAELAGGSLSVLIVESGDRSPSPWADALNKVESIGAPRVADQTKLRNRIFGGSSHTWSGRVAALDRMDFAERAWVPFSGWPFSRDEFARFLPRTLPHLGISLADNMDFEARRAALGDGAGRFDPERLEDYVWTYSRGAVGRLAFMPADYMRFGPRAVGSELPGVRCLVNATLVHVDTTEDGAAVTGLEVRGPDGLPRRVAARATVLCGGGIENARILLSSNRIVRTGVGNTRDQVGRYLMDHPRGVAALADPRDFLALQRIFGSRRGSVAGKPTVVMQGAALASSIQEREGLLNCAVWYNGVVADDDPYTTAIRLARGRGRFGADLVALAREAGFVASGAARLAAKGRTPPRRLKELELLAIVEQVPDPDSRVKLGKAVDVFGVPVPSIDWRVHELEKRTVVATTRLFVSECHRLGLPVPSIIPELLDPQAPLSYLDIAHPTGTTRMSADPARGVVDANCAVHGVAGLFAAGSSVFATSGHANPTQTLVALAVRLADHLKTCLSSNVARTLSAPAPQGITCLAPVEPATVDPVAVNRERSPCVLVTGGTGRVGSVVVARLRERGYRVRVLTSRERPPTQGIEWVVRDLRRADLDFSDEVAGCDAIIHLGAEMRHPVDMPLVNGAATRALALAAEAAGSRFMAYVSSIAVYGLALRRVCREGDPTVTADREVPGETVSNPWMRAYARTKLLGERAIAEVARDVEYVVFRPTVVVDVADVAAEALSSGLAAILRGRRNAHHIYVWDVAEALVWAMERSLERVASSPGVTTYNLSDETLDDPTLAGLWAQAVKRGLRSAPPRPWPAAFDRAVEYLRHIPGQRPRFSTPYLRFPADRLLRDGFRHPHGMRFVRDEALVMIERGQRTVPRETVSPDMIDVDPAAFSES